MGFSDVMRSLFPGQSHHKYTALPVSRTGGAGDSRPKHPPLDWKSAILKSTMGAISAALIGYIVVSAFYKITRATCVPRPCDTPEQGYTCQPNTTHSWGQYSPFFSVPSEIDASIPKDCTVTFAQILSRHGARDPTASKTKTYSNLISRIHASVATYGPGAEFVRDYSYVLGADQLTPFGRAEMANSGTKFYRRYRSLASKFVPFIRSSGQDRVVESALNWTTGYHAERVGDDASDALPYAVLAIPEADGVNNTLSHGLCTAFETGAYSTVGEAAAKKWLAVFAPPITERLNGALLRGANLTEQETVYLMDLCAFETVASEGGSTISPFCGLFAEDEWADYGYYQSVGKWYGYGPGNGLGAAQGVGWVNELIARLTGEPVVDRTTTNATLDADERTFPLGRRLYADFSHDNDMMGVYAAMGLYNGTPGLDVGRRTAGEFAASWTVPFAARMYVEKMVCGGGGGEEMVRVLVNDRVIPLRDCGADELGRCELGRFVESLGFARSGGNWDACFA